MKTKEKNLTFEEMKEKINNLKFDNFDEWKMDMYEHHGPYFYPDHYKNITLDELKGTFLLNYKQYTDYNKNNHTDLDFIEYLDNVFPLNPEMRRDSEDEYYKDLTYFSIIIIYDELRKRNKEE